ncbi:MAG: glycosyltransferase [Syntrophobacteraceae bacterium]
MSFVHLDQSRIRLIAGGADPNRIRVVPHGIVDDSGSKLSLGEAKDRVGIPGATKVVSSFGFFEPHKGVVEIIAALPDVLRRHNAMFVFLGGPHPGNGDSPAYIENCRALVDRLGIGDRVLLLSRFLSDEEISHYLDASDVIVMNYRLNRNEASGAAAVALSHARPVITSAVPPFSPLVGCTLQTSDFLGIAQAVELVLVNPRLSEYLVGQISEYRRNHSFARLAELLMEHYTKPEESVGPGIPESSRGVFSSDAVIAHGAKSAAENREGDPHAASDGSLPIVWHAPIFDPSGYADEARQFVLGLDAIGVPTGIVPINWSDKRARLAPEELSRLQRLNAASGAMQQSRHISIFQIFPPHFRRPPHAVYCIGRTMFETDRIPEEWVAACNRMDEIWVPSEFNVRTFAGSGVAREKLVKVPEGIDVELFRLDADPVPIPGRRKFNFLSIFDWHLRKGWDVLLRAFMEEFSPEDDVALILKVWSSKGLSVDQLKSEATSFLRQSGLADSLPTNIVFHEENVSAEKLPGIYRAADAFVLPTRGEGWGRPLMEAMLMGLPVIGTRWSGQLEFMNDSNSLLLDCRIESVSEAAWREVPTFRGHSWAEPSLDHLRLLMRHVVRSPYAARRTGEAARAFISSRFDRSQLALYARERFDAVTEKVSAKAKRPSAGTATAARLPDSGKPAVVWEGSQFVHHSLALINRELCLQLIGRGYDLSILPYEPHQFGAEADVRFGKLESRFSRRTRSLPAIHVRHQWPPSFAPPEHGHWVMIQPWEYGRIPQTWVDPMTRLVDEIWVPSRHVLKSYVASGVPSQRVQVIPNGVNADLFCPNASPYPLKTSKTFKFLFVGGTIWRKGVDVLLRAYRATFRAEDDVVLVVKDMGQDSFYKGQSAGMTIREIQNDPSAPEILYLTDMIEERQMPGLFTTCDCLVHPYRGEGFGLPVLEAMACGLPVVTTHGGATDDFCSSERAFLIPSRQLVFSPADLDLAGGSGWVLEPDGEALGRLMRSVFEAPVEAKSRAQKAREHVVKHFSWENVAERVLGRIHAVSQKPIRRNGASA